MAHNGNVIAFGRRLSVALVLAFAMVANPLLAYYCAASCEHAGAASSTAATCHHGGSPVARVGSPPAPCGQPHQPTLTTAPGIAASIRTFVTGPAVLPGSIVIRTAVIVGVRHGSRELAPDRAYRPPLPLRI